MTRLGSEAIEAIVADAWHDSAIETGRRAAVALIAADAEIAAGIMGAADAPFRRLRAFVDPACHPVGGHSDVTPIDGTVRSGPTFGRLARGAGGRRDRPAHCSGA